jgi:hypothetical protein
MNYCWSIFCVGLAVAPGAFAHPSQSYAWRTPLHGTWTNGAVYAAPIPLPVFDGSRAFPSDVRIFDDAQHEWPFYLTAKNTGLLAEPADTEAEWHDLTVKQAGEGDRREGVLSLVADVGFLHVPLRQMRFELGPGQQAYPLKFYGRDTLTNRWRWVADGGVHRMEGLLRNLVDLRQAAYRYYKMDFYHYEDPPPQLLKVQMRPEPLYVVFEAGAGKKPHLYFGSSEHQMPRYDLQRRVGPSMPAHTQPAEIGERNRNPAHTAAVLRIYGRNLALALLGLLAGLGLLVLLKRWWHQP